MNKITYKINQVTDCMFIYDASIENFEAKSKKEKYELASVCIIEGVITKNRFEPVKHELVELMRINTRRSDLSFTNSLTKK